jgi:hypothetical protein
VQDLSSNHVTVTGTTTYLGVKETLVADVVDNTSPSSPANPDGIRFTTYANGGAGGCESPRRRAPSTFSAATSSSKTRLPHSPGPFRPVRGERRTVRDRAHPPRG